MFTNILQPTHLIILLAVVLLFLGPKRLPEAGRALGHGLREFKSSVTGERGDTGERPAIADGPEVAPAPGSASEADPASASPQG